ncbi:hypothetical protein GQX74_010649 [Glossina fuscipes]|nr:hypothetical protein GQX74_010649 [Glossina fuscipes]
MATYENKRKIRTSFKCFRPTEYKHCLVHGSYNTIEVLPLTSCNIRPLIGMAVESTSSSRPTSAKALRPRCDNAKLILRPCTSSAVHTNSLGENSGAVYEYIKNTRSITQQQWIFSECFCLELLNQILLYRNLIRSPLLHIVLQSKP